ncbi:RNA polymerase sigma factor [Nocardiopsis sp. CNT-189]|uniref:RNA polymerase sigma factor n=1 Tax=Nocardiopsis oceanisediminis TaxID=2816862 RepID=UPI003B3B1EAC
MSDQTCDGPSPGELVERARAGDPSAVEALLRRYALMVDAIVHCYRLPHQDAADARQLVWCRLAEYLDRIREPERVGSWIARTAHSACAKQARMAARLAPVDPDTLHAVDHETPEAVVLAAERGRLVRAAIAAMDEPDRTVAALDLHWPRAPAAAVAEAARLPPARVEAVRRRARRRLKRLLTEDFEEFGGPPPDDPPNERERAPRREP